MNYFSYFFAIFLSDLHHSQFKALLNMLEDTRAYSTDIHIISTPKLLKLLYLVVAHTPELLIRHLRYVYSQRYTYIIITFCVCILLIGLIGSIRIIIDLILSHGHRGAKDGILIFYLQQGHKISN